MPTDTLRPPKNFPLEWGYLRSHSDLAIKVVDCFRFADSLENVEVCAELRNADVILISSTPSYLFWRCPPLDVTAISNCIEELKQITFSPVVLIGPHGTVDPKWAMDVMRVDFVFRGEVDALAGDDFREIAAGETTRDGSFPTSTMIAEEVADLGRCVYERKDLERSVAHCWRPEAEEEFGAYVGRSVLIESSRGCSFDCDFCLRAGFRRRFRLKDLSVFEQEVRNLSQLGAKYCFLIDETFGISWGHGEKVCQILADYRMFFGVQSRPDLMGERKLRTLAQAGCRYLELGTEAFGKDDLRRLGKFRSIEKVRRGSSESKRQIKYVGENVLDVTNPDLGLVEEKEFWSQVDKEGAPAPAFIPYPATPMGDSVLRIGASSLPPWEHAQARFQMYSLANRYSFVRRMLKKYRFLREMTVNLLPRTERFLGGALRCFGKSRFEMRKSQGNRERGVSD